MFYLSEESFQILPDPLACLRIVTSTAKHLIGKETGHRFHQKSSLFFSLLEGSCEIPSLFHRLKGQTAAPAFVAPDSISILLIRCNHSRHIVVGRRKQKRYPLCKRRLSTLASTTDQNFHGLPSFTPFLHGFSWLPFFYSFPTRVRFLHGSDFFFCNGICSGSCEKKLLDYSSICAMTRAIINQKRKITA